MGKCMCVCGVCGVCGVFVCVCGVFVFGVWVRACGVCGGVVRACGVCVCVRVCVKDVALKRRCCKFMLITDKVRLKNLIERTNKMQLCSRIYYSNVS